MRLWVYNGEIFSGGSSNLWKPVDFVAKQNSDFWFFWDTLINSLYFGSFPVSDLKKYGVHPDGTKKFLFVFFIFQLLNDAGRYLTAPKDFQYQNGKKWRPTKQPFQ